MGGSFLDARGLPGVAASAILYGMKAAVQRERNKGYYRVLHVPLWIFVFFTLPGGLTADLYAHGFHREQWLWLALVTAVCVWRGARGRLPGAEPRPYITHYGLEWPNLGYRVVCYTAAWIAMLAPWTLNFAGCLYAAVSGQWIVARLYGWPYDLIAAAVVAAAALDRLPRTRCSIQGELTRLTILGSRADGSWLQPAP